MTKMMNVTSECTSRMEVCGQCALVYVHLGANNGGCDRTGAVGFFKLGGFRPMEALEGKVKVTEVEYGWFKVEMNASDYLEWMKKLERGKSR